MKDLYLILYNSACCVGWAGVLGLSLLSLITSEKASVTERLADIHGFQEVSLLLTICQTAAILEIVHAMLKLVRSPVMVTFMQVMSRIVALVAVEKSINAQSKYMLHYESRFCYQFVPYAHLSLLKCTFQLSGVPV